MRKYILPIIAAILVLAFFSCETRNYRRTIDVNSLSKKPHELHSYMGDNFGILIRDLEYSGLRLEEESSNHARLSNFDNSIIYLIESNPYNKVDYVRVEYFTIKQTEALDRFGYWHNDFYDYRYPKYYGEISTFDQEYFTYGYEGDFIEDYSRLKYNIHDCLEDWIGSRYALGIDYYTIGAQERRIGIQVCDKNLLNKKKDRRIIAKSN